jgi:hypothetical protein
VNVPGSRHYRTGNNAIRRYPEAGRRRIFRSPSIDTASFVPLLRIAGVAGKPAQPLLNPVNVIERFQAMTVSTLQAAALPGCFRCQSLVVMLGWKQPATRPNAGRKFTLWAWYGLLGLA